MGVSPTDPLRETGATEAVGPIRQQPSPDPTKQEPQKEFRGPEASPSKQSQEAAKPSPMDVAKAAAKSQEITPQQVQTNINQLQEKMKVAKEALQKPLTPEHYNALSTLAKSTDKDLSALANRAGINHQPVEQKGKGVQEYLSDWIDGGQKTLGNVMTSLPDMKQGDLGEFMRMQMSVQRATQRVELMSSIIGSSVSGIKTLMSTQLG